MSDESKPEIWLVAGREPVLYQFPLSVEFINRREAIVRPAVPMLRVQIAVLANLFIDHAVRTGDSWRMKWKSLCRFAYHSEHSCDPELLVVWERTRANNFYISSEMSEFISTLYLKGIGNSPEELNYFWVAFKHHILDWLINRERPVDLEFIKLHNSPYRIDWQQVVAYDNFRYYDTRYCSTRAAFEMIGRGTIQKASLTSLNLLAFDRDHKVCRRHIEVEHTEEWDMISLSVEKERLSRLGGHEYIREHFYSVKRVIKQSIAAYRRWVKNISHPSAAVAKNPADGSLMLAENPEHPVSYFKTFEWSKVSDLIFHVVPPLGKRRGKRNFSPAHETMPQMPDIQQPDKNVRDNLDVRHLY